MNWYGNSPTNEWGPTITSAMAAAYDDALQRARALGIEKDKNGALISNVIARYIVAAAKGGICDPKALADGALQYSRRD